VRGGPWALGAGRRVPDAGTRGPDAPVTGIPHGNNARVIAMLPVGRALKVSGGRRGRRRARAGRRGRRRMAGSGRAGRGSVSPKCHLWTGFRYLMIQMSWLLTGHSRGVFSY
jgi:hypothetical protein